MQAMVRTLKLVIERRYGIVLMARDRLVEWMVRHASWCVTRYQRHGDGETSFKKEFEMDYQAEVVPFGECVNFRIPQDENRTKLRKDGARACGLERASWQTNISLVRKKA